MAHWNHRVIKSDDGLGGDRFSIHEVFYSKKGKATMWTQAPIGLHGRGKAEMGELVKRAAQAWDKPILEEYTTKKGKLKLREI